MKKDRIFMYGKEFMPIRVAAKMLGKRVRTVRDWIHKGKIVAIKNETGYKWYVDVDSYMEAEHADED